MALAVASVTGSNWGAAATTDALALPATINAGDLLIALPGWITASSTATAQDSTGDAWTRLEGFAINGAVNIAGFAKIADGDEDGGTVTISYGTSEVSAGSVYRITGFIGTIADDIDISVKATGTADANPPSVTAGWGSDANVCITWGAINNNEPVVGNPANYTEGFEHTGTNQNYWTGYRLLTAASDDPGTVDYDDADAGDSWAFGTLVVGPQGGAAQQDLTGALFQRAPTFFTGTVSPGAVNLAGVLFQRAPTFFTGTVAATYPLTGNLFQKAPTFFVGTVEPGAVDLAGVLFQKAPTFPQGAVGALVAGTLFQSTPTFFAGTVEVGAANLAGSLFQKAPTFFVGRIIPETLEVAGVVFVSTPAFGGGTITTSYQVTGILAEFAATFPAGFIANRVDHDTGVVLLNVTADPFGLLDLEEV